MIEILLAGISGGVVAYFSYDVFKSTWARWTVSIVWIVVLQIVSQSFQKWWRQVQIEKPPHRPKYKGLLHD